MITLTMVVFGLVKAGKERKEWVSGASRPTWHLAPGIITDLGATVPITDHFGYFHFLKIRFIPLPFTQMVIGDLYKVPSLKASLLNTITEDYKSVSWR